VIEDAILTAVHERIARAVAIADVRYRPFVVDGVALGWLDDARFERLARFGPAIFRVEGDAISFNHALRDTDARSSAIAEATRTLREEGALPAWRDELFAVASSFHEPVAFRIERGAARWFGVRTWAAHVNGGVRDGERVRLWFARRSPDKGVDPGMLDNLVGGGIAAGARVDETVVKESWEEAGIPAELARQARPVGAVHVRRAVFDGLQRETLFVHDLSLSTDFVPRNQDGEAVEHRLVDLAEAARLISIAAGPDEVTVDACLVVLDYFLRHGAIAPDGRHYEALDRLRYCSFL
jgi:8-oxo-dGTP pyrophosphatase MutT (NUDIX family)